MTDAPAKAKPLTRNQSVVLDVLRAADAPLTAYQILDVEPARANGLKAPLTVYRAVEKLIALGHVHRIERLNAFVACDHGPHHAPAAFMICETCKRTIEVSGEPLRAAMEQITRGKDFVATTISVELIGHCSSCAKAP